MKRIIAVALACLIVIPSIAVTSPATLAQTRHAASSSIAGPSFTFPVNGTAYPSNGPYVFQVQPVNGAVGYLWSFVQGGLIVYQNLAWDGHLSPASYTISVGSKAHSLIHSGDLHVWVRALMKDGTWSATGSVLVRIQGRGGPHPKPTATPHATATPAPPAPGTVLYQADTSGGLDKIQGGNGWKHLNGMLLNDGSGGLFHLPYVPVQPDYAVEVEYELVNQFLAFGIAARLNSNDNGYWGGFWNGGGLALYSGYLIGSAAQTLGSGTAPKFSPDGQFHKLRLEVKGNQVAVLYDGSVISQAMDNSYLDAGRIALWGGGSQVNIRAIRIIAL